MKETVELRCDECNKIYLFENKVYSRDLVGSHYCSDCFSMLMGRYKQND